MLCGCGCGKEIIPYTDWSTGRLAEQIMLELHQCKDTIDLLSLRLLIIEFEKRDSYRDYSSHAATAIRDNLEELKNVVGLT
jgi:hypothetical protein